MERVPLASDWKCGSNISYLNRYDILNEGDLADLEPGEKLPSRPLSNCYFLTLRVTNASVRASLLSVMASGQSPTIVCSRFDNTRVEYL